MNQADAKHHDNGRLRRLLRSLTGSASRKASGLGLSLNHLVAMLLGSTSCLLVGCVERTVSITSEPAGVLVYLNDEEVGRTPVEVPFTWYGTYDVRLEREGYEPKWTTGEAEPPWWEYPGPDLIAEMIPGAKSRVAWHYELQQAVPAEDVSATDLVGRADAMREDTRAFEGLRE